MSILDRLMLMRFRFSEFNRGYTNKRKFYTGNVFLFRFHVQRVTVEVRRVMDPGATGSLYFYCYILFHETTVLQIKSNFSSFLLNNEQPEN